MRLEERALAAEFPEYAEYAARTPRLVPRVRLGGARPPRGASAATLALAAALLGAPAAVGALDVPPVHGPAGGAIVDTLPAFGWDAVPGAERYEWQIAADAAFNSPVLGSSYDRFFTKNTRATMTKVVPNGDYWWRVRAVAPDGAVSQWSSARSITKLWAGAPALAAPDDGATISYPQDPFALSWSAVPGAARYLVRIGTDPTLASLVVPGGGIETQATTFTLLGPLAPGKTYYWGITPIDAAGNHGEPSAVRSFTWLWPSGTDPAVLDVAADPEIYDHRFEWDPVPGAAGYEVEVSSSSDFAPGSRACCPVNLSTGLTTIGTSYSPAVVLQNNNRYYWRVRAIDANGNAGVWNVGPSSSRPSTSLRRASRTFACPKAPPRTRTSRRPRRSCSGTPCPAPRATRSRSRASSRAASGPRRRSTGGARRRRRRGRRSGGAGTGRSRTRPPWESRTTRPRSSPDIRTACA